LLGKRNGEDKEVDSGGGERKKKKGRRWADLSTSEEYLIEQLIL